MLANFQSGPTFIRVADLLAVTREPSEDMTKENSNTICALFAEKVKSFTNNASNDVSGSSRLRANDCSVGNFLARVSVRYICDLIFLS